MIADPSKYAANDDRQSVHGPAAVSGVIVHGQGGWCLNLSEFHLTSKCGEKSRPVAIPRVWIYKRGKLDKKDTLEHFNPPPLRGLWWSPRRPLSQ